MPVGRGLLKIDDYIGFGKLFESLEKLGAYMISYSPGRGKVYAWFRGKDALKAEHWLKKHDLKPEYYEYYERKKVRHSSGRIVEIAVRTLRVPQKFLLEVFKHE